jgi:hypothetical protein
VFRVGKKKFLIVIIKWCVFDANFSLDIARWFIFLLKI